MNLKVNPTRQELLKIKKRLKTAKSGHALLKEKLDGLMQEFLGSIRELKRAREDLDLKITKAAFAFFKSSNRVGEKRIDTLIYHFPFADAKLKIYSVMGVKIRSVKIANEKEVRNTYLSALSADNELLEARENVLSFSDEIMKYANLTIKIRLMAEEIEKTRRRVNSLEHVYIPEMERVKKYISQKLEERERFDRTIILKLKETIN
jgi:V/A-type H+/Na+-transporting ATPase subunit D